MKITSALSHRTLLLTALFSVTVPFLQGCFPLLAVGIGASAVMTADRRSNGAYIDDESIEWKTRDAITDRFGKVNVVHVTSYNRKVLLTGQVQNESVRHELTRIARRIPNVKSVVNLVEIGAPLSWDMRSNDSAITTNVKARFLNSKDFHANHIKVVTEDGHVFLLGIVTQTEGNAAAQIAANSRGVSKVTTVFEYKEGGSGRPSAPRRAAASDPQQEPEVTPIPPEAP